MRNKRVCRTYKIDGSNVRVQTSGDGLTAEDVAALEQVVKAARRKFAQENPNGESER